MSHVRSSRLTGAPKGIKKNERSGRKKGTPNKRTLDLIQTLQEKGFDPAAKLVEITLMAEQEFLNLKDRTLKERDTASRHLATASRNCTELMKFVYPQRKAVDITAEGDSNVFKTLAEAFATSMKKSETK